MAVFLLAAPASTGALNSLGSLENRGASCWSRCGQTGPCDFCGDTGACCRKGVAHAACNDTASLSAWRHTCAAATVVPTQDESAVSSLYTLAMVLGTLATTALLCLLVNTQDFAVAMKVQMKKFEVVSYQQLVDDFTKNKRTEAQQQKAGFASAVVGELVLILVGPLFAIVVYIAILPFQMLFFVASLPVLIPMTLCEVVISSGWGGVAVTIALGLHWAAFHSLPWWPAAMAYGSVPLCALLLIAGGRLSLV